MKHRAIAAALLTMLLSGLAGQVSAQSFGSVSSVPPPKSPATTADSPGAAAVPDAASTFATAAVPAPSAAAAPSPASSADAGATAASVAAAGGAARPWEPAPFFSAPKVLTTPAEPVTAPDTAAAAGANVPPESAPAPAAFSSVSGAVDTAAQAGGSGPSLPHSGAGGASYEMAERIVIEKSKRRLLLLREGDVIAAYPVKLGLNPYGHKQREGDFRTPEGNYYLSRRNPRSEFFLSVEVSYPSPEDRARARAAGVAPGGLIMIHGQPNVPRKPPEYYASRDWTDGCIAVSNADMIDIWLRTRVGMPIEIKP